MATKTPTWILTLRRDLRLQNGEGWYVKDVRGRIQLAYRFTDGTQTTCTLELPWAGSSKLGVLQVAAAAKPLVEGGKSLKDAVALIARSEGIAEAGSTSWPKVAELFHQYKVGSGELSKERTWHRNYRLRIARAVELLTGKPRPTGGAGLLQALVDRYYPGGKSAGQTDRRLQIQYVVQMLKFAVEEQGADARWLPPADLSRFVGVKQTGHTMGHLHLRRPDFTAFGGYHRSAVAHRRGPGGLLRAEAGGARLPHPCRGCPALHLCQAHGPQAPGHPAARDPGPGSCRPRGAERQHAGGATGAQAAGPASWVPW